MNKTETIEALYNILEDIGTWFPDEDEGGKEAAEFDDRLCKIRDDQEALDCPEDCTAECPCNAFDWARDALAAGGKTDAIMYVATLMHEIGASVQQEIDELAAKCEAEEDKHVFNQMAIEIDRLEEMLNVNFSAPGRALLRQRARARKFREEHPDRYNPEPVTKIDEHCLAHIFPAPVKRKGPKTEYVFNGRKATIERVNSREFEGWFDDDHGSTFIGKKYEVKDAMESHALTFPSKEAERGS